MNFIAKQTLFFIISVNISKMTVRLLVEMGHDVRDIRGSMLEGTSDKGIWDLIQNESRMLITTDKGFMQYRSNRHKGIRLVPDFG